MKTFRQYNINQQMLLPPDLRQWLRSDHLALYVSDVVEELDLGAIMRSYEEGDMRGRPPYHPLMMVKLLVYGYATGKRSSRKIEQATYDDVAFRVLAGNQHPDHDSIAEFRKRHFGEFGRLFVQVLEMCERLGLVKLGHVAIDGTKMRANASKRASLTYERMNKVEKELEAEVARMLAEAERIDDEEDKKFGKGKRGDELPEDLRKRESRLAKIRETKAQLESEMREAAEQRRELDEQERAAKKKGETFLKHNPKQKWTRAKSGEVTPKPEVQRNLTDKDARVMMDTQSGIFQQAYNPQIAVDSEAQIIVAARVTQQANDFEQLVPTLTQVKENMGRMPDVVTADAGFFSARAVTDESLKDVDLFIPPSRMPNEKTGTAVAAIRSGMREKLSTLEGIEIYKKRNTTVEPVFADIKHVRGYRQFLLRGLKKVDAEWVLICMTHNLLKMFRKAATA